MEDSSNAYYNALITTMASYSFRLSVVLLL